MTSLSLSAEAQASDSSKKKESVVTSNKIETVTLRLEERIAKGEWEEHESLPPQSHFAREYGVSLGTIALAFRNLHKRGRIHLVPYKGASIAGRTKGSAKPKTFPLIALQGSYVQHYQLYLGHGGSNPKLVSSVIEAAEAEHCPLLLLPKAPDGKTYDLAHYRSRDVQGVIFLGGEGYDEAIALRQAGFPVLLANQPVGPTPLNFVDYDHSSALQEAVDRFHENGHRRIAVIAPLTTTPSRFNSLMPEFLAMLLARRNFYDITDYWLSFDRTRPIEPQARIRKLFDLKEPPTAIFCLNPALAAEVLLVARELDLQVPRDLSVIGSCFVSVAEMSVSGFALQHEELGRCLLHEMRATIENPFYCVQKQLPLTFIDRRTVGLGPAAR